MVGTTQESLLMNQNDIASLREAGYSNEQIMSMLKSQDKDTMPAPVTPGAPTRKSSGGNIAPTGRGNTAQSLGGGLFSAGVSTGNPWMAGAGAAATVIGGAMAKDEREAIMAYKAELDRKSSQGAALNNLASISQQLRNL